MPPRQRPEQQSAPDEQAIPVSLQGTSQKPPRHRPPQQSALFTHATPVGVQPATGPHFPAVQSNPQHSALKPQSPPSLMQGTIHTSWPFMFGVHLPLQQSASAVQPAPSPWQTPGP